MNFCVCVLERDTFRASDLVWKLENRRVNREEKSWKKRDAMSEWERREEKRDKKQLTFDGHDQLHAVEAVQTKLVHEVRLVGHLRICKTQMSNVHPVYSFFVISFASVFLILCSTVFSDLVLPLSFLFSYFSPNWGPTEISINFHSFVYHLSQFVSLPSSFLIISSLVSRRYLSILSLILTLSNAKMRTHLVGVDLVELLHDINDARSGGVQVQSRRSSTVVPEIS